MTKPLRIIIFQKMQKNCLCCHILQTKTLLKHNHIYVFFFFLSGVWSFSFALLAKTMGCKDIVFQRFLCRNVTLQILWLSLSDNLYFKGDMTNIRSGLQNIPLSIVSFHFLISIRNGVILNKECNTFIQRKHRRFGKYSLLRD